MLLVAGCQAGSSPGIDPAESIAVTDDLGRTVQVPRHVRRIVSLTPTTTEILFAVGAGKKVVGVSGDCNYPAEATSRETVGRFHAPSLERIVALEPDVVFAGNLKQPVVESLARLGIPVVALFADSLEGVYRDIHLAGRIAGTANEADALVGEIKTRLAKLEAKVKGLAAVDRPRVCYLLHHGEGSLWTASGRSYLGELLDRAGGRNVFAELETPYPSFSEELLLAHNPQVILVSTAPGEESATRAAIRTRPGWHVLDAVTNHRIHCLDADLMSRPGPRIAAAAEAIAAALTAQP